MSQLFWKYDLSIYCYIELHQENCFTTFMLAYLLLLQNTYFWQIIMKNLVFYEFLFRTLNALHFIYKFLGATWTLQGISFKISFANYPTSNLAILFLTNFICVIAPMEPYIVVCYCTNSFDTFPELWSIIDMAQWLNSSAITPKFFIHDFLL